METDSKSTGPVMAALTGVFAVASAGEMTPWITANFAQSWYSDAVSEAKNAGPDARRREIIFAIAAAESYLFEWTRDVVLKCDYSKVNKYFPPGSITAIRKKWKQVPKALCSDKLISDVPDLSPKKAPWWTEFEKLVDYRNGLFTRVLKPPCDAWAV